MNKGHLILTILILSSLKGLCNQDVYSYKTFGNLTAKIEIGIEKVNTDKAFKCVEFCSYLTNQIYPDKKIYIEIYTLTNDKKEDFFVSFGNGKKEIYNNYGKVDRKGKVTQIRKYEETDSLDNNAVIIRYISTKPDYKKLTRLIYSCLYEIDLVKYKQSQINYIWFSWDWTFMTVDSNIIQNWINSTQHDEIIENILKDKTYKSELCKNFPQFTFTFEYNNDTYKIITKSDNKFTGVEFKELIWFDVENDYGIFMNSDSTFYIADSKNNLISNQMFVPIKFSEFRKIYFSKKYENVLELSVMNFDNLNFNHEIHDWFYLTKEKKLIDVSNINEKERKKIYK